MNTYEISTYLLNFILLLVLFIFTKRIIPFIKNQIKSDNLQFIKSWVDTAVAAAEQKIKGSKLGAERKKFVIEMLESLEIIVDDAVDNMIEAAVFALNASVDTGEKVVITAVEDLTNGKITKQKTEKVDDYIEESKSQ